jgi:hypothetical protein
MAGPAEKSKSPQGIRLLTRPKAIGGPRKVVGIVPSPDFAMLRGMLLALAELFPVEFRDHPGDTFESLDAIILLQASREVGLRAAGGGVRCLAFLDGDDRHRQLRLDSSDVQFAPTINLHPCLRRQVLTEREPHSTSPLQPEPGDEVVASRGNQPVWLHRVVGKSAVDFVSGGPPQPAPHDLLRGHLCGRRFMFLLPLFNFLQELTREIDWCPGPLRACLVLDDPSLYYRSYGCLNFSRLAAHARAHRYHAAVAMVPLDAMHASKTASSVFRENPASLSLLIHGNDHSYMELFQPQSAPARFATLAQALKRIAMLEDRQLLRVSRIMEAPHAVFASDVFPLLVALGYEAALVTTELLSRYNPNVIWPPTLGLDLAGTFPGGLHGIPRIILNGNWKTEVVLAAFLGQPIVVAGHHYDAAADMQLFARIAGTINGLGEVQWSDTQSLSRTNYKNRRAGDQLSVKMYSRRITLNIPAGVRQVTINRSWLPEDVAETLVVCAPGNGAGRSWLAGMVSDPVPVSSPAIWEITSISPNAVDYRTMPSPRGRLWPVVRKVFVEVRDRAYPLFHRQ